MFRLVYHWILRRLHLRPLTYVIRDWSHRYILEALLAAAMVGLVVGALVEPPVMFWLILGFLMGMVVGHIWWCNGDRRS